MRELHKARRILRTSFVTIFPDLDNPEANHVFWCDEDEQQVATGYQEGNHALVTFETGEHFEGSHARSLSTLGRNPIELI